MPNEATSHDHDPSADRYDELMGRRAALDEAVRAVMLHHRQEVMALAALSDGSTGYASQAHSHGIMLLPDGSLIARLTLRDAHALQTEVTLRARPGEAVDVVEQLPPDEDVHTPPAGPRPVDERAERLDAVTALARQHLPSAAAADFLALRRPALRLVRAREGEQVIAQLGGLPTLPVNSWPVWEGHGPLPHVLSFDCGPVADLLPELGLPSDGRLAFFYYDGSIDDPEGTVGAWDPSTRPGFRVLHLHPEGSTRAHVTDAATPAPPGVAVYPTVPLTAVRTLTWPSSETPASKAVWRRHGLLLPGSDSPIDAVHALDDALSKLPGNGYDTHQIGGHACPQQGPVELEVEKLRRGIEGLPFSWNDPEVHAVASDWNLLLQVASDDDADMMWGDVGQLYFLAVDPQQPQAALFTWQCG